MDYKIIKEILLKYRTGISFDNLKEILKDKKILLKKDDIKKQPDICKLNKDIVFLRSTLIKTKEDFLQEFNDYLEGKIVNKIYRKDIINIFLIYLSDELFIDWLDIPLERKILIFDLLISLINKQDNLKDKLKIFFNQIIDCYSALIVYLSLFDKNFENDFKLFMDIIELVEPLEEELKNLFYSLLTKPDTIKSNLSHWKRKYIDLEKNLIYKLNKYLSYVKEYSPSLFKRVFENELKELNIFSLLKRFHYVTLFEWITDIFEEKDKPDRSLYEDLDL